MKLSTVKAINKLTRPYRPRPNYDRPQIGNFVSFFPAGRIGMMRGQIWARKTNRVYWIAGEDGIFYIGKVKFTEYGKPDVWYGTPTYPDGQRLEREGL